MDYNFDQVAGRVHDSFNDEFLGFTMCVVEEIEPHCKSPIEIMLGSAILVAFNLTSGFYNLPFIRLRVIGEPEPKGCELYLTPQYKWKNYTVDFALYSVAAPDRPLFIECDGHDFHERTKEQAEHDRSRDRIMQENGIPILRFTGREIHRSPSKCATSILNFVYKNVQRFSAA